MTFNPVPFDVSEPGSIENLQVVFKVVERCNINCSYCYYFNMGETTAMTRPPSISTDTAQSFAYWIAQGCCELQIPKVLISFHGGEPMMLKPRVFKDVCETLRSCISPVAEVSFSLQTNGTILSDEWLSLFEEYVVRVGISIDGDREAHDRYRLNHRGGSTFDRTENTLKRIAKWAHGNPKLMPATISVVDHRNNYKKIYRYLRDLGVERMSFLLPDRNADAPLTGTDGLSVDYGRVLFEIFEAWLTEDNPIVHIKYVHRTLGYFQLNQQIQRSNELYQSKPKPTRVRKDYQIIIARSDGTVAVNDSYIPALSWYQNTPIYSILSHSLRDFLSNEVFREIEKAQSMLPSGCSSCQWKSICKGGDLENRYSEKNLFDNPSVYCEGYKFFYQNVCDLLIDNGYPPEVMQDRFALSNR